MQPDLQRILPPGLERYWRGPGRFRTSWARRLRLAAAVRRGTSRCRQPAAGVRSRRGSLFQAGDIMTKTARVLRLSPEDNILVAGERIEKDASAGEGVTTRQRIPFGHKLAANADRRRRAGRQVRPDHRLRQPADRRRRLGARAQLQHGARARRLRRATTTSPRAAADRLRAGRRARDVRGLPALQRQGRHAQLSRHPDQRELLGDRRQIHGARRSTAPASSTTIPPSTASCRSSTAPAAPWT